MRLVAVTVCVVSLLSAPLSVADTDTIEYVAVESVVAFDKRPFTDKDNIAPWDRQRMEREKSKDGYTQIVVSNSCGFAEFIYNSWPLSDYIVERGRRGGAELRALVSLSEWCRVAEYAFDAPTLLKLRNWNGVRYLVGSTRIYRDDKGRPYIAAISFINQAGWASLKKAIEPLATWVCVKRNQMTARDFDVLQRNSWLMETPNGFCYSHGVYLEDVLAFATVQQGP